MDKSGSIKAISNGSNPIEGSESRINRSLNTHRLCASINVHHNQASKPPHQSKFSQCPTSFITSKSKRQTDMNKHAYAMDEPQLNAPSHQICLGSDKKNTTIVSQYIYMTKYLHSQLYIHIHKLAHQFPLNRETCPPARK